MTAFTPRSADGRSAVRIVQDLLAEREVRPGQLVTYAELHKALGRPTRDRKAVQDAVRRASELMLRREQRILEVVPREGYRLAESRDHLRLGQQREDRSLTQFRRAVATYRNTRLDELTPAERDLHLKTTMLAQASLAVLQDQDRRISRIEAVIDTVRAPKVIEHDD